MGVWRRTVIYLPLGVITQEEKIMSPANSWV
jgi:hypothetical protein